MSDELKKGFNATLGVVLALVFIFIILPLGTCAGCMVLGTAASVGSEAGNSSSVGGKTTPSQPDLVISNIVWKVLDENPYLHEATFKFDVTNHKTRKVRKSFRVVFEDKDGLPIDETYEFGKQIPAGGTITVTGKSMMDPGKSAQLVTMKVEEK